MIFPPYLYGLLNEMAVECVSQSLKSVPILHQRCYYILNSRYVYPPLPIALVSISCIFSNDRYFTYKLSLLVNPELAHVHESPAVMILSTRGIFNEPVLVLNEIAITIPNFH